MITKITYSGTMKINNEKTITVNDPALGPQKFTSDVMHRFRLVMIEKCGSLVSFIKINKNTFISANIFVRDVIGRYVITLKEELVEHKLVEADIDLIPVYGGKDQ